MNSTLESIRDTLKNDYKIYSDKILLYLIILKYKCDIHEYNIDEIINTFSVDELSYLLPRIYREKSVNKVLDKYRDLDAKDALIELLNNTIRYTHNKENTLFIGLTDYNYEYYNPLGNSGYIERDSIMFKNGFKTFKLMDKILGVNNKYLTLDDINKNEFEYLYINSISSDYRINMNLSILDIINDNINNYKSIILNIRSNRILNFTKGKHLIKYLQKIEFDNSAEIYFSKTNIDDNHEVSFIIYHHPTSFIDVEETIEEMTITTKDIEDNHYKLAFQIYKINTGNKRNTLAILEENKKYLDTINRLNDLIEKEVVNIFMNKES